MDWKFFNEEYREGDCFKEYVPTFVEENGYLPIECRECHKALIYWDGKYSKANIVRFNKMVEDYPLKREGKYNDEVVVFYLPSGAELQSFLGQLRDAMQQYEVEGNIQWAVSGAYWHRDYPQFFLSAKKMKPVVVDNEISIKDWLSEKAEVKPRAWEVVSNLREDLELIGDEYLRMITEAFLEFYVPVGIWKKRSSLNHHCKDERGDWGNLRHTKRVVKIAYLLAIADELPVEERDLLIAACIVHDVGKYGVDGKAEAIQDNHPELVRLMFDKTIDNNSDDEELLKYQELQEKPMVAKICDIVDSHMGQWGNIKPVTKLQKMCHYADYIASREDINIPVKIDIDKSLGGRGRRLVQKAKVNG